MWWQYWLVTRWFVSADSSPVWYNMLTTCLKTYWMNVDVSLTERNVWMIDFMVVLQTELRNWMLELQPDVRVYYVLCAACFGVTNKCDNMASLYWSGKSH